MDAGTTERFNDEVEKWISKKLLLMDPSIKKATEHYIDDIIVNQSIVTVQHIVVHLQLYGLQTKPFELPELGLQLTKHVSGDQLWWI